MCLYVRLCVHMPSGLAGLLHAQIWAAGYRFGTVQTRAF